MLTLKQSLNPSAELGWSDPDPCKWNHVVCSEDKRVTRIQIGRQGLQGTLPAHLGNLTKLERLELQWNNLTGQLPTLNGLSSLQVLMLSNNQFTFIPSDFFTGMSSLQSVEIDNNPLSAWEISQSLQDASALVNFSANSANITGKIPGFFGSDQFPSLINLHLAFNDLEGELPPSFAQSQIQSLWVNGQKSHSKLSGKIDVIQNMTFLKEIWLHSNSFSGPLPDFSGLKDLNTLSLRDNMFTGVVPFSLVNLESLAVVKLTNNLLQGPMPEFKNTVSVDMTPNLNSFCLPKPGDCDFRVNSLLTIVKFMGYPSKFAESWTGNDPCTGWIGITCNNGNITIINFQKMGLVGTISPAFSSLKSLQKIDLADNNLTGSIPNELNSLPSLTELDVSNNQLYGKIPSFKTDVVFKTNGNSEIGKEFPRSPSPNTSSTSSSTNLEGPKNEKKSSSFVGIIVLSVIGGLIAIFLIALFGFFICKRKQKKFSRVQSPNTMVIHPRHSGSDNDSVKITVAGSSITVGSISDTRMVSSSETSEVQMVESGNMVISIQVLRNVTNNFGEENILGRGGFGTVYKGELHDGTKIAVKRMESGVIAGKGLGEFKSEISVLTKVRHRHLVALLGYCLDGNEKLLVYEYMPQGTLSRHLFDYAGEGLKPLEWPKRLSIALDVARGVEYLHGLAHQSFIHRDLKPSNILLGDDMKAKVADFGLVRLAPEGKGSIETRIAGTFGYLAPEYAGTKFL